jgi:signal transduction histidine kinase
VNMSSDDLARMSRVLRHRLRNYASGIKTSVTLLSRELKDRLTPSELEYFPLIVRECENLAELTERLSLLLEDLPASKESVVATAIEQVMTRFRNLAPTAKVRVNIAPEASNFWVSSGKCLEACLEELLLNAHEAAPFGEIVFDGAREPEGFTLRIKDQSPGLKALAPNGLFTPFYTTKPRHVGIGLSIARRLAEALGGRVEVSAGPSGGAIAELLLPVRGGCERNRSRREK